MSPPPSPLFHSHTPLATPWQTRWQPFLCMYMLNHPTTLVQHARVTEKGQRIDHEGADDGVDPNGINLAKFGGDKKEVRTLSKPQLVGYEEVKGRPLQIKVDNEDTLGVVKHPKIIDYVFPSDAWWAGSIFSTLTYMAYAPKPKPTLFNVVFLPAVLIRDALPTRGLTRIRTSFL